MTVEYQESKNGKLTFKSVNSLSDLDLFLFRAKKLGVTAFEFDEKTNTISFSQPVDTTGQTA